MKVVQCLFYGHHCSKILSKCLLWQNTILYNIHYCSFSHGRTLYVDDRWQVTFDMLHFTHDMWQETHLRWHKIHVIFFFFFVLVLLSAHIEIFSISHMRDFELLYWFLGCDNSCAKWLLKKDGFWLYYPFSFCWGIPLGWPNSSKLKSVQRPN